MTDTTPSPLARAVRWLDDEGHTLAADAAEVFRALVVHARALEAVFVKDGPAVMKAAEEVAPVAVQVAADVKHAATGGA